MSLQEDNRYQQIVSSLRTWHGELLDMEKEGNINAERDNPAKIGEYLTKLRLHANMLYSFMNFYLDVLNTGIKGTAEKRQKFYEEGIAQKKSENASKNHAQEMTRVDDANVKIIENTLQQIKNEYERYNGICISLQSRMREFDTERRAS